MSREIKFRLYEQGRMTVLDKMYVGVGQLGFSEEHYVDLNMHDEEPTVVMQYTGLKDKNGVEIYEGDIVRLTSDWDDEGTLHQVKYFANDGYPAFDVEPSVDAEANGLSHFKASGDIEVIGNIYENPELLEAGARG